MGQMSNYDISVIIRVKNERRWIGYCIQSIIDNFQNQKFINSSDYHCHHYKPPLTTPYANSTETNHT